MLIDDAISGGRNVIKILKYKDYTTETRRMWNLITKLIPVKMATIWTDFKIIQKISEQHTEKARKSRNCRKQPYRGTAHVFRKELM